MATSYASELVEKPGGTGAGGDDNRQSPRRTDNSIHQPHHLPPRDRVGAQQAATSTSNQPSSDLESYPSRTHNKEPIGQLYEVRIIN